MSPLLQSIVEKIHSSRVYEVAEETSLESAARLSSRLKNTVLLKREDQQVSFSFKVRGAYNKMAHLGPDALSRGVVASSAGNHAQGVALAAAELQCKATIVMPTTTPQVKIDAVTRYGGPWVEVRVHGETYSDTHELAMSIQAESGSVFVHPFDDPLVIAGQGTIGMEILNQHPADIDAVFVAIGGGGLISGVGACFKSLRPETRIIGVQAEDSASMKKSLEAGEIVRLDEVGLFSDGTAVKEVGEETFKICAEVIDEIITVDTDSVCAAISDVFIESRSILEPAGALSIAGLKAYAEREGCTDQTLVAIACGANMNFNRLRFISQRAEVGRHKEAVFAITIPEERGSFRKLCDLVGDHSVTEFNYRIADAREAHILVGIGTQSEQDGMRLSADFNQAGFKTIDLSHDELAKTHLRHMVGGRSPLAKNESLYRFKFPERPGALMRFLSSIPSRWNISLFHYRSTGSDFGDVLVGFQGPDTDKTHLEEYLRDVGYRFWDENDNPAYHLFLIDE